MWPLLHRGAEPNLRARPESTWNFVQVGDEGFRGFRGLGGLRFQGPYDIIRFSLDHLFPHALREAWEEV